MDGAEEKLADKENVQTESAGASATDAEAAPEEAKQKTAVELEKEAKDKVNDLKRKVENLKAESTKLPDEFLGYAGMAEKEIKKQVGEHEYKIHFFKDAKQGYTSLGSWDKFNGPLQASFKRGTRCWDGPERELKVNFECGAEAQILDVAEPSKCVYEATVTSPGACDIAELERYNGIQIIGPKDEL